MRLYTNDEWEWQVRLLLRDVDIPGIHLGPSGPPAADSRPSEGNQLGWTSWLGARRSSAEDVVIQGCRCRTSIPTQTSGAPVNG